MNIATVTGKEEYPALPPLLPDIEYPPEIYELRRDVIIAAQRDPLRYGFEPEIWKVADFHREELRKLLPEGVIHEVNLGGNRSSKSERAAKRVVQALVKNAGSRWWCAEETEESSRGNQQRLIYKYIPPEWKNRKRDRITKVTYTIAGGFTENNLVLPNGSECQFKFYKQGTGALQAVELDGFWGDELLPFDWIETIDYRLVNLNGIFHLTFTPVAGFTTTVGHFLTDSKLLEETEAELLPRNNYLGERIGYEKVPRVLQCKDLSSRVIYFHTKDNPFGNYEGMKVLSRKKGKIETKMRVYGVVDKAAHARFPMFREDAHVISMNRFDQILHDAPKGTRYHLVDPCSGRNWFMLWIYCPSPSKAIVYREWPSHSHTGAYIPGVGDPGEWAIHGDADDGERGPAQEPFGFGLERYKQEIERMEGKEEIYERWIDSRYANAAKTEREGTTTLIEQMRELDMDFLAMTGEKNIMNANDGSIDMINSALYYDQEVLLGEFSPDLARLNEPQLLVTENCPNTIWGLTNWTNNDGQHGACKDPIDCIRGFYLSELEYIDEGMLTPRSDWQEQFAR